MSPKSSSNNVENDAPSQNKKDKSPNHTFVPTLRKYTKTGYALSPSYYNSVKEAVFDIPCKPFAPLDVPESLKESDSDLQVVHVCGQCKDW